MFFVKIAREHSGMNFGANTLTEAFDRAEAYNKDFPNEIIHIEISKTPTIDSELQNKIRHLEGIRFTSRREAEAVAQVLDELCTGDGVASIADYYNLIALTPVFTDNKYGWKTLDGTAVERVRDGGYKLVLPPIVAL